MQQVPLLITTSYLLVEVQMYSHFSETLHLGFQSLAKVLDIRSRVQQFICKLE